MPLDYFYRKSNAMSTVPESGLLSLGCFLTGSNHYGILTRY